MSAKTSLRKIAAARANGKLSRGPKTSQGKFVSSRNAIDHGLTAQFAFLPGDDPLEYQAHHDAYRQHYAPVDDQARNIVAEIADLNWRLRRAPAFEAATLSHELHNLAFGPNRVTYSTKAEYLKAALALLPKSRGMTLLRRYTGKINRRIDELHSRIEGPNHLPQFRPYVQQKLAA